MEKGFDKLSHRILIDKMKSDGFSDFTFNFVINYLSSRLQRVRWQSTYGDYLPVCSGIPQGSCIGPFVFNYYCADMPYPVSDDVMLVKYADDIIIIAKVKLDCRKSPLLSTFSEILRWSDENKMTIKSEKSHQMFVTLRSNYDMDDFFIPQIPVCKFIKILGVTFDSNLNFRQHVHNISKKASSRLHVLRKLKPFLPTSGLVQIYNNCVRSILEYSAAMFVGFSSSNNSSLERVQNRAHKIICGSSTCDCSNFLPLEYRRLMIGFDIFSSLSQDQNHPLHHLCPQRLAYSNKFTMPVCLTAMRSSSFLVKMIKLSNSGFVR